MIIKSVFAAAMLVATGGALAQATDTHPMGQGGNPSGATTPGPMSNDAMGDKNMDHRMAMDDGITMKHGKWLKDGKPATKAEIAAHKQMMKSHKPM